MSLEATLPPKCGAILWLAAADTPAGLIDPSLEWFPHIAGAANTASIPASMLADTPIAVWQSVPTEVPFGPTLLKEDPIQNTQGLFMVLVQRAQKAVRSLRGRYLAVRIQLQGDGHVTPEIAGLRVYGSRFSYVQNYLPEIYHEGAFGSAAEKTGSSTRRDFFERFIDLFEAQFTRIEDHVANAYLLTRSESTPEDAIGWLGSWIGIPQDNYPPDRGRTRLQATPFLYKWRGTTRGVTKALDVATNGMASRGAIIVIEDFRLRHIFATILGADLSDQNDPLLPGFSGSSNSFVGDTLFLSNPAMQAKIQALYATDLNIAGSTEAVQAFYDQLALRMTVFVHNQVEDVNLNLVQSIVQAEKPAHVLASVKVATQPFMIGLASLLGINTYLGPDPPRNTATVDVSSVGRYDVVTHMPSLDPRMEDGLNYQAYAKPIARIQAPAAVKPGGSIQLDGSVSSSPPGTTITLYTWTLVQPK
jgi:phage tail-like protein